MGHAQIESAIKPSGVNFQDTPPSFLKGDAAINASERIFGFVLPDYDPRWCLPIAFAKAHEEAGFSRLHYENALRARYLSREQSFRNRHTSFVNVENFRQLSRAINNLGAYPQLLKAFDETSNPDDLPDGYDFRFARTNRILNGTDSQGVTGCPEALFQIRLTRDDSYVGRVGFNLHLEDGLTVLSATNLQGIPHGKEAQVQLVQELGEPIFNLLVRRLKALGQGLEGPIHIRGIKNPTSKANAKLYNGVFKKEGVDRYSFYKVEQSAQDLEEE